MKTCTERRFDHPAVAIGALLLGIVLLVLGVYFEEPARIFEKATMICLQCIGIG
jgi:hypothetical protein